MAPGTITMYPSGNRFNLLRPDPALIELDDIAHALGQLTRFGGRGIVPYSVAQHSVNVRLAIGRDGDKEFAKMLLLHDAAEAYVGEMVCDLKHLDEMEAFRWLEFRVGEAVCLRFGLPIGSFHKPQVKKIDQVVGDAEWEWLQNGGKQPEPVWDWQLARSSFRQEAAWLGLADTERPAWMEREGTGHLTGFEHNGGADL